MPTPLATSVLCFLAALVSPVGSGIPARTGAGAQHSQAAHRAGLQLPVVFGDGMVLQRGQPIAIWGWTDPRAAVNIEFHGTTTHTRASATGSWAAKLPSVSAGGPFEMKVSSGGQSLTLHDVLVGDVWIASGQSNMEFPVAQANDAAAEIAAAHDSSIREFKIPNSWSNSPEDKLAGGSWAPADSKHVGAFSAVAYFFARALRKSVGVPIGIVNSTWSGSNIETWISRPAAGISDSAWKDILRVQDAQLNGVRDSLRAKLGALPTKDAGLVDGKALWADPSLDDSGWSTIQVPAYWEGQGYPGMDGIGWYRVSFEISNAELAKSATLSMSAIDDDDITWINGIEIGRTAGYNITRSYPMPTNVLHAGKNTLAVRVVDGGGGGGINGATALAFGDGTRRSLNGAWKFKVGEVSFKPDGQQINKVPSILYNKMIHPLVPLSIKGVLWYQGESNANNMEQALAYRAQFKTLIESWRQEWSGKGPRNDFPFLWVQLPNYGPPESAPPMRAAWATQREAMEGALSLPHTGEAISIDVGDAENLHPKNKQEVGKRLALVALKEAYGRRNVVAFGPTFRSLSVRGDTAIIEFSNVGAGLVSHSKTGDLGGFSIAGADQKLVWASAKIVGNTVHVWSSQVAKPAAVRYLWSNSPVGADLYNKEGLPAAPFRTDRWK